MGKKSKKDKSDVIVKPEDIVTDTVMESAGDSEEDLKKSKKKRKKEKKKSEMSLDDDSVNMDTSVSPEEQPQESPKKKKKRNADTETQDIENPSPTKKIKPEGGSVVRSAKERMKGDYAFISSFLEAIHIPKHKLGNEDILEEEIDEDGETLEEKQKRVRPGETTRANTREELKERLQAKLEQLRGGKKEDGAGIKKEEKKLKKKLAKIEKKKKETDEMKQKLMTVGKGAGAKKGNLMKGAESMGAVAKKPGVKTDKGVIFSKFDFKDDMAPKEEQKKKLDPQAALNKLKKNKEKIKMWEEKGKTEKASKIENNIAWENALNKAQGEKVKDDVTLLKKSIKKNKQIKTSSKKKWDKRADDVKSKESAFVEKREGNLNKRIKEKKDKKIKKLVAKGRHVPGF